MSRARPRQLTSITGAMPRSWRRAEGTKPPMPLYPAPDLHPAIAELFTVCAAMALLMIGVFRGEGSTRLVSWLAVAVLVVGMVLLLSQGGQRQIGFSGLFV